MKKSFLLIVLCFAMLFTLASCKKDRTYAADGQYLAYSIEGATKPEVTFVTVTIKDDKLVDVDINTIQSNTLKNAEGATTGYEFKAESKKELGYKYYMFPAAGLDKNSPTFEADYKAWLAANGKKEWFEQVEIIEAEILANGTAGIVVNESGKFENLAGVTVSDHHYVALAEQAIANAKAGKKVAIATHDDDLVIATADVNEKGELSNVLLDTVQGQFSNGAWSFKAQSKQQLGYKYYMFPAAGLDKNSASFEADYKAWLAANGKKEWFEQAALIVSAWEANHSLVPTNGKFPNVAGVTISDNCYIEVLNGLLK